MIGQLNRVVIAGRDIAKAAAVYRDTQGAEVFAAIAQPEHGVTAVFTSPHTKVGPLGSYGEGSPIAKFIDRNPDGGIHHRWYEVDDIITQCGQSPEHPDRRRRTERRPPSSSQHGVIWTSPAKAEILSRAAPAHHT
jgi:methylmalonyl-CoA epimerase